MYGDDVWFKNTFSSGEYNLVTYLSWRYATWTSRMIIEAIEIFGVSMPVLLWRVLNTIVIVAIGVFLSKILVRDEHRFVGNIAIVSLMLLYPYIDVISVGMVAGSVNYFWPFAFGLIAIYPLRKIADGKKIRGYEYILYFISLLIASNQEQMCFVLLTVYLAFTIHMVVRKNVKPFVLAQLGVCILSLMIILACPGNACRNAQETTTWFPEYASFTFLQKAELGVSAVLQKLFLTNNILFLVLSFLVFILVWQKHKNVIYSVVAAIPLLLLIALSALYPVSNAYEILTKLFGMVHADGIINAETIHSAYAYLVLFGLLIACGCLLISLYRLLGKGISSLIAIGMVLIGFSTKAVMGFSPTVWASGERTAFYLMFAMIACAVYILNRWDFTNKNATQLLLLLMVLCGVYGSVANMVPA